MRADPSARKWIPARTPNFKTDYYFTSSFRKKKSKIQIERAGDQQNRALFPHLAFKKQIAQIATFVYDKIDRQMKNGRIFHRRPLLQRTSFMTDDDEQSAAIMYTRDDQINQSNRNIYIKKKKLFLLPKKM